MKLWDILDLPEDESQVAVCAGLMGSCSCQSSGERGEKMEEE